MQVPSSALLAAGVGQVVTFGVIAANPDAGDVIPGADGARKVRWQSRGAGKRGSARVIYFHLVEDEVVLLVMVYAKAERANVKPKDIKRS